MNLHATAIRGRPAGVALHYSCSAEAFSVALKDKSKVCWWFVVLGLSVGEALIFE